MTEILSDQITIKLYDAAANSQSKAKRRSYLGMSSIGDPCSRKLWYGFHGVKPMPFDGRTIMLFRFGDRIEEEIIGWLRLAGYVVSGQQEGFSAHNGMFLGHCDGVVEGVTDQKHILEIKSCNDRSFKSFSLSGVKACSPTYYAQVQCYMGYAKLEWSIFVIQNKNDSKIYTEQIEFDAEEFIKLEQKALEIITAKEPPDYGYDKKSRKCDWCGFKVTCMPKRRVNVRELDF